MIASLGALYFVVALYSTVALCTVTTGNGLGLSIKDSHGVAGCTLTWRNSSVKVVITTHYSPSMHMLSMWFSNPKTFFFVYCLGFVVVRITFRSGGVCTP